LEVAKSTVTVWPLAAERETVKTALVWPESPSTTATSEIWRSGWPSSSMMVPVPWASVMDALEGLDRLTRRVSLGSLIVSPRSVEGRVGKVSR
jgi:hypothetical protein